MTRSTASAGSSSAENWFVATADNGTIEYELDDLVAALQSGRVRSHDLVWRQGMSDWLEMDRVPLLRMIAGLSAAPTEPSPATPTEPPLAVSLEPAAAPIAELPPTASSETVQAALPTEPPLAVPTEPPPATPTELPPPEKPAQAQSIDDADVTTVQPLIDLPENNEWASEPDAAPKPELQLASPKFAVAKLSSPPLLAPATATQDEDRKAPSRLSERAPRKPLASVAPKPSPPIMVDRTRLPERVAVKPVATPRVPAPEFWMASGERVPLASAPAPKPAESAQSLSPTATANPIARAPTPSVSSNPVELAQLAPPEPAATAATATLPLSVLPKSAEPAQLLATAPNSTAATATLPLSLSPKSAEPAQPLATAPNSTAATATLPLSLSPKSAEPAQPLATAPNSTAATATLPLSLSPKSAEPAQPLATAPAVNAVTVTQKPSMRPKPAKPIRSQAPPPAGKAVAAVPTSPAPASNTLAVVSAVSVTPVAQINAPVAAASADVPQQAKAEVAQPSLSAIAASPVVTQTPVVEEPVGSVLPSVTSLYPDEPHWRKPRRQLYYVSGGIIAAAVAIFLSVGSRPSQKAKRHAAAASSLVTAVAEPKDSQPVSTMAAQSVSPASTAQDITTLPTTAELTASKPTKKSAAARPSAPRSAVATRPSSRQVSELDDTTPAANRSTQKAKTESAVPASTAEASWDQGTVEHRSWMSPGF